ncbi:MAG: hypothetical protein OES84_01075, partial [Kiritimatiellaceae bacterium]|nr:hypothetical protein [Kiritimatiellaceae bacterium]
AETELRWDFTKRWSAVGFIGTGWRANGGVSDFSAENNHPAGGVGFRYLIARVFQLRAGIDIAVSEEGNAFYITTGNGWKR